MLYKKVDTWFLRIDVKRNNKTLEKTRASTVPYKNLWEVIRRFSSIKWINFPFWKEIQISQTLAITASPARKSILFRANCFHNNYRFYPLFLKCFFKKTLFFSILTSFIIYNHQLNPFISKHLFWKEMYTFLFKVTTLQIISLKCHK